MKKILVMMILTGLLLISAYAAQVVNPAISSDISKAKTNLISDSNVIQSIKDRISGLIPVNFDKAEQEAKKHANEAQKIINRVDFLLAQIDNKQKGGLINFGNEGKLFN